MIFWTIIGIILTLTCISFIIYINKNWRAKEKNWPFICAIVAGAFAFLTFFTTITIRVSYIEFEQKFMIQKETYSQINFNTNENSINLIVDIIDANDTLTSYQAIKKLYGDFSVIPERVLDLTPIGIAQ